MDNSWSSWSDEEQSNRQDLEKYEYKLAKQYAPGDNLNEDLLAAYEKEPECDEWNSYFVKWMRFVLENNGKIEIEKVEEWIMQQPRQVRLWLWKRGFLVRTEKEKKKRAAHYSCNITLTWVEEKEMWRASAYKTPFTKSFDDFVKQNETMIYGFAESKEKEEAIQLAIDALYGQS